MVLAHAEEVYYVYHHILLPVGRFFDDGHEGLGVLGSILASALEDTFLQVVGSGCPQLRVVIDQISIPGKIKITLKIWQYRKKMGNIGLLFYITDSRNPTL